MKTTIRTFLIFSFTACVSLALTGTDPSTNASFFQLDSVQLNPDSFVVTLVLKTPVSGYSYGIMAHEGPPASNATWTILTIKDYDGPTMTFIDGVSGPLAHLGKTYRGLIKNGSSSNLVTTANEIFIPYPFLSAPEIKVEATNPSNDLLITYGEGIYSNRIPYSLPAGQKTGFFRVVSPDNDPVNAVVQVCTNLFGTSWTNVLSQ